MSLLVKGGRVLLDGKLVEKNILCENGLISSFTSEEVNADETVDAKGKIVIPGMIDPHVHFRDPGLTHKEDLRTGSMAAAKGGITTFFDMPNTIPPMMTVELLHEKKKIAAQKSLVNYGFHFGAAQNNLDEIKKALPEVPAVKVFMDATTGNLKLDDFSVIKDILDVMPVTAFHAENEHIDLVADYLSQTKNRAYIVHTSSSSELDRCRSRPELNDRLHVEVTAHHLFLNQDDVKKLGAFAEMKPSLKTKQDNEALWKGIQDGRVDTIGTDHAPHLPEEKKQEDFPFGIPSEETVLPLLLDATHKGRLSLPRLVELTSQNTARIFGIQKRGLMKEGYAADLTLIDYELEKKVRNEDQVTRCGWTPYDGKTLKGWPVATIVNGQLVYQDGEFFDGHGQEVTYER